MSWAVGKWALGLRVIDNPGTNNVCTYSKEHNYRLNSKNTITHYNVLKLCAFMSNAETVCCYFCQVSLLRNIISFNRKNLVKERQYQNKLKKRTSMSLRGLSEVQHWSNRKVCHILYALYILTAVPTQYHVYQGTILLTVLHHMCWLKGNICIILKTITYSASSTLKISLRIHKVSQLYSESWWYSLFMQTSPK